MIFSSTSARLCGGALGLLLVGALPSSGGDKKTATASAASVGSATSTAPSASASAPAEDTRPEVLLPPAGEPGPAYFKTTRGIVMIGADGATTALRKEHVSGLILGVDGHGYGYTWDYTKETAGIFRLDGAKAVSVGSIKRYPVDHLAVASHGTVFAAAHHDELHTIRGGKSTIEVLKDSGGIMTDGSGAFSLSVPLDEYSFTYLDRGGAVLLDAPVVPKDTAKEGAVVDLGTIRIK